MRRSGGIWVWAAAWAVLAAPAVSRAYDNDLVLEKLGPPNEIRNGDEKTPADPFAQERFSRFVGEFVLALVPLPSGLPNSLGDAGFEFLFTADTASIHRTQAFSDGQTRDVWPTESAGGATLFLPTLTLRKGLPFGFEVGSSFGYVSFSSMVATSANLKWSVFEGFHFWPDVSVQAFGTTVLGTGALSLVAGGWGVNVGERFAPGGGAEFALYGGVQRIGVNATTNNIDFNSKKEDSVNPTTDDGVFRELSFGPVYAPTTSFWRAYGGAQYRMGVLVIGVEAAKGWGENLAYSIPAGTTPGADNPSIPLEVWKIAGRIGVAF